MPYYNPDCGEDELAAGDDIYEAPDEVTAAQISERIEQAQKEEDFWLKLGNCTEVVPMASTPARLYILVAHIQLALRHPAHHGASSEIAREIALNMTEAICHFVPEARESIERGWDPAYDLTQDYFDAEFT